MDRKEMFVLCLIFIGFFFRFVLKCFFGEFIDPIDFHVYYQTALNILQGHTQIYEYAYGGGMYYKYSPLAAFLFLPLGFMPYKMSSLVWATANISFLVLSFYLIKEIFKKEGVSLHVIGFVCAIFILLKSITALFHMGQADLATFVFILLSILFHQKKQRGWAALAFSVAISIKLQALIFVLFFLIKKDYKSVFWTGILFGVTNFIAAWILNHAHPLSVFYTWKQMLDATTPTLLFGDSTQTLLNLLSRYFQDTAYHLNILSLSAATIKMLNLILELIFVMGTLGLYYFYRKDLFLLSSLCIFMLLFSPITWLPNYLALLLPIAWIIAQIPILIKAAPRIWIWLLIGVSLILDILTHKTFWNTIGVSELYPNNRVVQIIGIWPMFALVLYVFLIYILIKVSQRFNRNTH